MLSAESPNPNEYQLITYHLSSLNKVQAVFVPEFWVRTFVLPLGYYRGDEVAEIRNVHIAPGSLPLSDIHGSLLRNGYLAEAWDLYAILITLPASQSIDDWREDDSRSDSGAQFASDAQHCLVDSTRRGLLNEGDDLGDLPIIIILVTGSLAETLVDDIRC